jgi:hypothetical protein
MAVIPLANQEDHHRFSIRRRCHLQIHPIALWLAGSPLVNRLQIKYTQPTIMTSTFAPHLDILPPPQRRLWDELGAVPSEFVLYGGTAVALHLGHRQSVDFDLFADRDIDPQKVYQSLAFLDGSTITQQEPNTLTCLLDRSGPVKVSFFGLPHIRRIREPVACPGNALKVASMIDLAATKALVVQQRAQAKDYMDIDALITAGITLPEALAAAKLVYGSAFSPTPTLKALSYFGDGDLETLIQDVRERLVRAVQAVDPLRLPSLNRIEGRHDRTDRGRSR